MEVALLILTLVVLTLVALGALIGTNRIRVRRSVTVRLQCDDDGCARHTAGGAVERVEWDEVNEVEVVVSERAFPGGSLNALILASSMERGVLIPGDWVNEQVLTHLEHLDAGLGSRARDAMSAHAAQRHTLWQRPGTGGAYTGQVSAEGTGNSR